MKTAVEGRQKRVVSLSEYRKQRQAKTQPEKRDPARILDEVSYYLLQAAKAMSNRQQ